MRVVHLLVDSMSAAKLELRQFATPFVSAFPEGFVFVFAYSAVILALSAPRFSECWQAIAGHGHLAKDVEVS